MSEETRVGRPVPVLNLPSYFSYKQWKYFMQLIFHFIINLKILARRLILHSVTRPSFIFVFRTHINTLLNHGNIIKLMNLSEKLKCEL